jgi:PEP-CTERM motif
MKTQHTNVGLWLSLILITLLGSSESSFGTVTRNANGTYTARVSVNCTGGSTTKSATGNTPLVMIPPPNNLGCNAGTSARAQRVVGTGEIVENATAVRGDKSSAGSFSLNVIGVRPFATASFTMQETDMTSTLAQYLISWKGDLGTAGQVQWFDLSNSNQLDILNLPGGTSQTTTVDISDPNGIANIGFDAEIDAASIAPPVPEPSSLLMLGSGAIGIGGLLRKRWLARA